ncbi:MAG TPA: hypothetical protein VFL76_06180 [Edaphocola sp.]|nr:hypothetical protein [Edaphocola sp.]
MDYRDWEQKIKEKLDTSSPEEAGFSVSSKDIWKQISAGSKPQKRSLFLFRPVVSHIAAAFLGILMSTLAYLLLFQNPKPQKVATVAATGQEEPLKIHERQNHNAGEHRPPARKVLSSGLNKAKTNFPQAIVAHKPHDLNNKRPGTKIKPEIIKDTVHEYATASPSQRQPQDATSPKVVYWSDIENNYKHKSEPKYWATLVHKIDKRLEKDKKSNNAMAPAVAWIQTFK